MKKEPTPKESEQPNKELQVCKVDPEFQELLDTGIVRDLGDRWELSLQNERQDPSALDKVKLYFPKRYYNGDFIDVNMQGEWNLRDWQFYNALILKSCYSTETSKSRGVDLDQVRRLHPDDFANCCLVIAEVMAVSAPKLGRRSLSR